MVLPSLYLLDLQINTVKAIQARLSFILDSHTAVNILMISILSRDSTLISIHNSLLMSLSIDNQIVIFTHHKFRK